MAPTYHEPTELFSNWQNINPELGDFYWRNHELGVTITYKLKCLFFEKFEKKKFDWIFGNIDSKSGHFKKLQLSHDVVVF